MTESTIQNEIKVIESGIDGIWTYRKWSDGTAECWGNTSLVPTSWVSWGNIYETKISESISFPINLFIDAPMLEGTVSSTSSGVFGPEFTTTAITKDKTPRIFALSAGQTISSVIASLYAIGKWR